ncbi:MAG: hypothetical protein HYR51_13825 [Candidatus Rokubacteria bacterium]|nr:hypothetical protein [Candidatus Rokubacteria bacterium]
MTEQTPRWIRNLIGVVLGAIVVALALVEAFSATATATAETPEAAWATHLRAVDEALAERAMRRAARSWSNACLAARAARSWRGMLEVGDAALRIGEASGTRAAARPKARQLYLAAFFGARQQQALDGILRAAESFAALGDHDVSEQCLREGERLAADAGDPDARLRVARSRRVVAERLARAAATGGDPLARLGPARDEP